MMFRALFALIATLLLQPAPAGADHLVDDSRVDLTAPTAVVDAQRERWRERLRKARGTVAEARVRHTRAEDAYGVMRHRPGERGAEKAQVMTELTNSKSALADAEAALRDLISTARTAGVPPGWMRLPRPDSPAAPPN